LPGSRREEKRFNGHVYFVHFSRKVDIGKRHENGMSIVMNGESSYLSATGSQVRAAMLVFVMARTHML